MNISILPKEDYRNVLPLFNLDYPNLAFVYGIIEGVLPGKIWVDSKKSPKICLIMSNIAYCFIGGELNDQVFAEFICLLKEKGNLKLVCESSSHDNKINCIQYGFQPIARVQYRYTNVVPEIKLYPNDINYIIQEIKDEETLSKCIWGSFLTEIYGSKKNYLKSSIGFIFWDVEKKQVVSEAHGVISKDLIEIGTITHEDYRNQGLSTIICNHLVQVALKRKLQPLWTCDETNLASNRVAQHLGMDDRHQYIFHTLKS